MEMNSFDIKWTGSSYSNKRDEERNGSGWHPPNHPGYTSQGQDMPSSTSYIPSQYPSSVQGSYPPNFQGQQNFGSNYGYPGYESTGNYYPPNPQNFPHATQPPINEYSIGAPTNHPPTANWEMFPDTTQPPPIIGGPGPAAGPLSGDSHQGLPDIKAEEAKKEAIEQELLQQKRTLAKQREDYVKRKFSLNRELNRLKDQKRELLKENSKENERILRENAKLQNEILQKLKSIDNVIEMLSNIIGDSAHLPEVIKEIKSSEKKKSDKGDRVRNRNVKHSKKKRDKSEERRSSESADEEHRERDRTREREHEERDESRQKDENRVYYDPGLHWCSECNVFPKTVSEYLEHLHSPEHKQNTKLKLEDYPWHLGQNLEEKTPVLANKGCPPKRIPIRGVQFLIPATAWFCSMCKVWLGDVHCANKHIQSNSHSTNYNEFIMKNQHWEVDWLTERTRSYERNSEAKQLQTGPPPPPPAQPPPTPLTIATLSDQLLAMIAANSKVQEPPPPPPPPPITKSTSSSEDDSPSRRFKKKKKKSKKSKKEKDNKSPSKEKEPDLIKLNYKPVTEKKTELVPHDDNFISEWMPKVEKREAVQIKPKQKNDVTEVRPLKRSRRSSAGSQESSGNPSERFVSPDDNMYDDHDDAVIFDKKPTAISSSSNYEKDQSSRSKKREEEVPRHGRHSKYDRSPKEKLKYDDRYNKYNKFDKYKQMEKEEKESRYEDYKSKKENKSYINERDKHKKSPVSRLRDIKEKETERKRGRGKLDKNDDDDVHETSFEKRTSESAAKKKDGKKVAPNNLPKTKLPFIGRMPILKKKVEQKSEEKEEKKDIEDSTSKDSIPELALLQEPVVEALPTDPTTPVEELPKSTLIISKRPRLAEPGIVKKEILFNKPANDNLTETDMDLDDDSTVVPKEEEPAKDELHKDFKDALDLLFPEEKKTDSNEEVEVKQEAEVKIEEQQAIVASAAPTTYMLPAGYDMSMYQTYYDHAYVQQWAQMGYDQTGQYTGAYAYPPPAMEGVQQSAMEAMVQSTEVTAPVVAVPAPEPKKKKNPLSQRMRRHLQKKKAKEAVEKAKEGGDEAENEAGNMEYDIDEEDGEDFEEEEQEQETENEEGVREVQRGEGQSKMGDMSDLALLGIDEDDAAAQGFY
ncbi:unnamed protein product [Nezara viridula]|uniref:U1-type domain-containing protein n=1 Tax=Nezara viridula TaxID=85310 RepID=A0A9P0HEX5_NEZVI|nr:unnamed protein product [Nezara viridula]